MNKNKKDNYFQLVYSSSGSRVARAYPGTSGLKAGNNPGHDTSIEGCTHTHPITSQTGTNETRKFISHAHLWQWK